MTIKEAAAVYGVSTQAIYQRIAKAGKRARDLTEGKTSDLTQEGESLLATWFAGEEAGEVEKACQRCKLLEQENAGLQALNNVLQAQIAALEADKDRLYSLLNQAQQAQALTVARLPAGNGSVWQRLKNMIKGRQDG